MSNRPTKTGCKFCNKKVPLDEAGAHLRAHHPEVQLVIDRQMKPKELLAIQLTIE